MPREDRPGDGLTEDPDTDRARMFWANWKGAPDGEIIGHLAAALRVEREMSARFVRQYADEIYDKKDEYRKHASTYLHSAARKLGDRSGEARPERVIGTMKNDDPEVAAAACGVRRERATPMQEILKDAELVRFDLDERTITLRLPYEGLVRAYIHEHVTKAASPSSRDPKEVK